jgi:hypothetical protein
LTGTSDKGGASPEKREAEERKPFRSVFIVLVFMFAVGSAKLVANILINYKHFIKKVEFL